MRAQSDMTPRMQTGSTCVSTVVSERTFDATPELWAKQQCAITERASSAVRFASGVSVPSVVSRPSRIRSTASVSSNSTCHVPHLFQHLARCKCPEFETAGGSGFGNHSKGHFPDVDHNRKINTQAYPICTAGLEADAPGERGDHAFHGW